LLKGKQFRVERLEIRAGMHRFQPYTLLEQATTLCLPSYGWSKLIGQILGVLTDQ